MIADVSNGMHSNIHITATNRRYPNRLIQIKDTSIRSISHASTWLELEFSAEDLNFVARSFTNGID